MKNHKVTMLIAGAIIMIGAIAAPAMPVVAKTTETVETAIAEDAGMPEYKYTGSLPYMDAVCEEILAENESLYDKADVAIPEPYIVRVDDSDQNDVKVWGRFGYFTYKVDGPYLQTQAGGLPGALSKVGLDIFVDPRNEGPGINRISINNKFIKYVEVDGEEYLYYKLPKLTLALIKGTAADLKGNISFDDMFMSGDALSICQAVKANHGKVIVQVDKLVDTPSRPRNAIIPGCLVDAIVVEEAEKRNEAYTALTGSFEIPYDDWNMWSEKIDTLSTKAGRDTNAANIIGRRAAKELRVDDIVNIGIGIPEMVSRHARKNGMLDNITLTVESGGIGGFPVSGEAFGAMIGAASVYDMANQFDLYNNGGLDVCFMGAYEVDAEGNVNAHRGPGDYSGIGGFANITAKTPTVVFCLTFNTKGLDVVQKKNVVTIQKEGSAPKFVKKVASVSFSAKRAIKNGQKVLYVTERCVFQLTPNGLKLIEVYPGIDAERDIIKRLPFEVER